MDTYKFTVEGVEYAVTRAQGLAGAYFSEGPHVYAHISAAGLEMLRLADENGRLKALVRDSILTVPLECEILLRNADGSTALIWSGHHTGAPGNSVEIRSEADPE